MKTPCELNRGGGKCLKFNCELHFGRDEDIPRRLPENQWVKRHVIGNVMSSFGADEASGRSVKEDIGKYLAGRIDAEDFIEKIDGHHLRHLLDDISSSIREKSLSGEKRMKDLSLNLSLAIQERHKRELAEEAGKLFGEEEQLRFRNLLIDSKNHDLSRMFCHYEVIPRCLKLVAAVFKFHVSGVGNVFIRQAAGGGGVQDQEEDKALVQCLIKLHDTYMLRVVECFNNHTLFHKALKEAFEIISNKSVGERSSSELLADFLDNLLKKVWREEVIEKTLENVVKYISDKDLFIEFYRKKLARRLFFHRTNQEHERRILSMIKVKFGGHFTSRMERMVNDITSSKEHYLTRSRIHFTVTVLTRGVWPSYKTSNIKLPNEMVNCVEAFKTLYKEKRENRTLTWIFSLGKCQVMGRFDSKQMELVVSTYQAALLLLFNHSEKLSYNEIFEELNLSREDLERVLLSLSSSDYRILKKQQDDSYEFNSEFKNKLQRIKIPLPPVDERKKVVEDVDKDRRHAIDAALVRIMKSRKVLPHQQLVSECIEGLSRMFKPDIKLIKTRIEDLISREYLERDKENLKYLA